MCVALASPPPPSRLLVPQEVAGRIHMPDKNFIQHCPCSPCSPLQVLRGESLPWGRKEELCGRGTWNGPHASKSSWAFLGQQTQPGPLVTAGPGPQPPAPGSAPPRLLRCSGRGAGALAISGALRGHPGLAAAPLQCVGRRPQAQDLPAAQALAPSVEHSELRRRGPVSPGAWHGCHSAARGGVRRGGEKGGCCLSQTCPCSRGGVI